ncbi:MAG: RecX family transcriptional regulator [Chloroflexi bacterium]|nr:RecX family transcriptional regulator [Chloroflexota bacterium]
MAGTITALKAQRSAKDRVNVHIDGEFAFGLALIHAVWLKTGQLLSDEEIVALRAADTLEQAQQRAVNLIAFRPRSVREVRQRLQRADVDAATIERVVEQLRSAGLLDDEAFSKAWVESRLRAAPRGRRMIAWELRRKGVADSEIEAALEGVNDEDAATEAARRRWPKLASLPPRDRKRKLFEFLARSGFEYSAMEEALRRIETDDLADTQE